jgi:type II secretion system protein J
MSSRALIPVCGPAFRRQGGRIAATLGSRLKPGQRMLRVRAFTLIEVMVAITIFAIVLAAMNAVFFSALRLRTKSAEAVDAAIPKEQALAIIRKDLANIVPPGGKFFGTLQTTPSTTNTTTATGANGGLPMNTQPGQSSPQFYTSSGVVDETVTWGDVQMVSYQLVNSTNGGIGKDLFRTATRNLLPVIQSDPEQESILSGVDSIYFLYHDGTAWKDTWDSTQETLKLPRAIKVQIALASEQRGRLAPPPIEMVVPLIDAGTNTFATTTTTQ